jgi:hypothetical protein
MRIYPHALHVDSTGLIYCLYMLAIYAMHKLIAARSNESISIVAPCLRARLALWHLLMLSLFIISSSLCVSRETGSCRLRSLPVRRWTQKKHKKASLRHCCEPSHNWHYQIILLLSSSLPRHSFVSLGGRRDIKNVLVFFLLHFTHINLYCVCGISSSNFLTYVQIVTI